MKRKGFDRSLPWIVLVMILASTAAGCSKGAPRDAGTPGPPSLTASDRTGGESSPDTTVARCTAHSAPVALCFLCDPSHREAGRLWCAEHERYEDRCWICHPELRDTARLFCDEHGLYEDECFYCHPGLGSSAGGASAERRSDNAPAGGGLRCTEHDILEGECGICHPELADRLEPGQGVKIRFPSEASAQKAGVAARPVTGTRTAEFLEAPGRLEFNRNRYARLAAPLEGTVTRVLVDLGQDVVAGQALLEMSSPQWAEARASFRKAAAEEDAALAAFRREEDLHARRVSSGQDLDAARSRQEAARAARRAAEETLAGFGLTAEAIAGMRSGEGDHPSLTLRAPFAGTVVSREASMGETATPGVALVAVADLDPLWAVLSVPAARSRSLRPGQSVEIRAGGAMVARGRLVWVADALQESTRMVEVRVEIPNPDRALRAGTFVQGRIQTGGDRPVVLVPSDAVHRFGGRPFVFLELGPDLYEARRVEVNTQTDNAVAVTAGLAPGDRVVMSGSYLVKSEFQKSRLGAGCVD